MSKKISKAESNSLYRTMKFIHDTFVKHKIQYWLSFGTLLGAMRHGGVIPWDDDGDICVMKKDIPKLAKLVPYFKKHGYTLEKVDIEDDEEKGKACAKVKNSCDWFISHKSRNSLGIDVFVMTSDKEKITYANPYWKSADGKTCYFLKKYVFPLVPVRFGNFYLYVPNNPVEYLNRCYGSKWNDSSQMLYNHRTGKWVNSKLKKMKPMDFKHPQPPKDTCDPRPPDIGCPVGMQRKR